ncbi:hypothetical protein LTR50_004110 [Elasticomyces elasticus]|nr:hypothetical protein LTR50_004110 [Elasticomyces elasticus]
MSQNPAIDPPRFPSPEEYKEYRTHSTSPSRSPARHGRYQSRDVDSAFRKLSPSATLRALTAGSGASIGNGRDDILRSVQEASSSEKAFATRAAQTCREVKTWCGEVEQWEWHGSFEEPGEEERAAKRQRLAARTTASPDKEVEFEYWGCLPSEQVVAYEKRIEEIKDQLDELDVEELKDHIRNAHVHPRSQPVSAYERSQDEHLAARPRHLDDFTALVTATILQALPYLARLSRLLHVWTVRLTILRQIPGFLRELKEAQTELKWAWSAITPDSSSESLEICTKGAYEDRRALLEKRIAGLGTRLDAMLDDLEGREDTVPDRWIDEFESMETEYSNWSMEAERRVLAYEFKLEFGARQKRERIIKSNGGQGSDPNRSGATSLQDATAGALVDDDKVGMATEIGPTQLASNLPAVRSSEYTQNSDLPDISKDLSAQSPAKETIVPRRPELIRADSATIPGSFDGSRSSHEHGRSTSSASIGRSRHVPIVVDYGWTDEQLESAYQLGPVRQPLPLPPEPWSVSVARAKAAAAEDVSVQLAENRVRATTGSIRSSIDLTPSPQSALSSVRSFEQATQAFTRLFSRSSISLGHSRSSSTSSRGSGRRKPLSPLSISNRSHNVPSPRVYERSTSMSELSSKAKTPDDGKRERRPTMRSRASSSVPIAPIHSIYDAPAGLLEEDSALQEDAIGEEQDAFEALSPSFASLSDSGLHVATNWPLPPSAGEEELSSPRKLFQSASFERNFVDSLPATPAVDRAPRLEEDNPMEAARVKSPNANALDLPAHSEAFKNRSYKKESRATPKTTSESTLTRSRTRSSSALVRPPMLPIPAIEEGSTPGSLPSDPSSPEIRDASAASYFRPKEVHTSPPLSRVSSAATARHARSVSQQSVNTVRTENGRPGSPLVLRLKIPEHALPDASTSFPTEVTKGLSPTKHKDSLIKRASITSIESFHRSELRAVDVRRSGSFSSVSSATSPVPVLFPEGPLRTPTSPLSLKTLDVFPTPTPMSSETAGPRLSTDAAESPFVHRHNGLTPSPLFAGTSPSTTSFRQAVKRHLGKPTVPPLNAAMVKRKDRGALSSGDATDANEPLGADGPRGKPGATPAKQKRVVSAPDGDQFDRHVSTVLESLPSRIRFTSSRFPQPSLPEALTSPHAPASNRPRPPHNPVKQNAGPGLTITPAFGNEGTPKTAGSDPDIKLYHLTQPGKDRPIKLFVRLVGEGERVMVRVGGGWADLGEYLRQYAEHHGRRTVSEGRLEVQEVTPNAGGSKLGATSKTRTPLSRPDSSLDTQRPGSAHSSLKKSAVASSSWSSTSPTHSPVLGSVHTPANNALRSPDSDTPSSTRSNSRPSTASRPNSRQSWTGDEIGLAGPTSSKNKNGGERNERKARWVEGMIEKAKKASSDKRGEERAWGDLGRMGGTRRIVFKHGAEK